MRRSLRFSTLVAVAALTVAACGGSDDASDVIDDAGATVEDSSSESGDSSSGDDVDGGDGSSSTTGAGFGDMISGTVTFSGAENEIYQVDDPAYTVFGAGGCGDGEFGISVNARATDTGFTVFQLDASIDEDLSGGATGTFDVEEMSLIAITDGDMSATRGYSGPGTLTITEHDTGGADFVLDERRMALMLEGTLDATGSDGDGTVDLSADVLWVMGCP